MDGFHSGISRHKGRGGLSEHKLKLGCLDSSHKACRCGRKGGGGRLTRAGEVDAKQRCPESARIVDAVPGS